MQNSHFHHLGPRCACYYFRPSKPHSGTLWSISNIWILNVPVHNFEILFRIHLFQEWYPWSVWRPRVAAAVVTRTVNTVMSLLRFINIPRMPPRPYHHHHRPAAQHPKLNSPPRLTEPRHFYESMIWILFCCRRRYCSPALHGQCTTVQHNTDNILIVAVLLLSLPYSWFSPDEFAFRCQIIKKIWFSH